MAFGPNSSNPRERRAFAHTKLVQFKRGQASYEATVGAVKAASRNRKGQTSGFSESLGKTAVLLVDWGATNFERPGIIHHNFGGLVMSKAETERWVSLGTEISRLVDRRPAYADDSYEDPQLNSLHGEHNKRYDMGYEEAGFTRIFRGEPTLGAGYFPGLDDVINPAEIEDILPLTGWNDTGAVDTRVALLQ